MAIAQWLEAYQQRRWIRAWLNSPPIKNTYAVLSKLYDNVNAHRISLDERKALDITDPAYTYGEIDFFSFAAALKVCEPKAAEVFYDIGAGAGKTVFAAALLYDFSKTQGIEALPALHSLCLKQLDLLLVQMKEKKYFKNKQVNIEFSHQNLLETAFSDADILFVNATCYIDDFWQAVCEKINGLKVGSRIILASKRLKGDCFALIDAQMAITSWGSNSLFIYTKIK